MRCGTEHRQVKKAAKIFEIHRNVWVAKSRNRRKICEPQKPTCITNIKWNISHFYSLSPLRYPLLCAPSLLHTFFHIALIFSYMYYGSRADFKFIYMFSCLLVCRGFFLAISYLWYLNIIIAQIESGFFVDTYPEKYRVECHRLCVCTKKERRGWEKNRID